MRIEYFEDTDTLQITFSDREVVDVRDLDEDTLVELDASGRLVTITLEHAQDRTDVESLLYKKVTRTAA